MIYDIPHPALIFLVRKILTRRRDRYSTAFLTSKFRIHIFSWKCNLYFSTSTQLLQTTLLIQYLLITCKLLSAYVLLH